MPDGLCPECRQKSTYYPVEGRTCYECGKCGYQIYPFVKTILENTKLPINVWIAAIYEFAVSKNFISATAIGRKLEIKSYDKAFKMCHKIRSLLYQDQNLKIAGHAEVDETPLGGKSGKKNKQRRQKRYGPLTLEEFKRKKKMVMILAMRNKQLLFGIVQRNGILYLRVIERRDIDTLIPMIKQVVLPGAIISTDDYAVYKKLSDHDFDHKCVVHKYNEYKRLDAHTQTIDGAWSNLKSAILSTFKSISRRHTQAYLDEFAFRYNRRHLSPEEIAMQIIERMLRSEVTTCPSV